MFNSSTGCIETPTGANMKVLEYTGFIDINKKDIFTGYVYDLYNEDKTLCVVEFFNGMYVLRLLDGGNFGNGVNYVELYLYAQYIEYKGNIFENPEYLK